MRLVSLCAIVSLCALVEVCPPALGAAQTSGAASVPAPHGPRPVAVIPFHRNGKLIALDVRVGASRPLSFVLDSGASHSIVDRTVARELKLRVVGTTASHGTGRGTVPVQRLAPVRLALRGAALDVAEPWAIALGGVSTDAREDGLIGSDLFRRYVVRLDLERGVMSLFEPSTYRRAPGAATVPLTARKRWMYLPAELVAQDGTRARHELVIDTGSEDSVDDPLVTRSPQRRSTVLGNGLGADYAGASGVLARVRIGPFVWNDVWGPASRPAVGMEMLRRFTLTFDLSRRTLELVPNAHLQEPVPAPQPSS
jgi:Aspartyl protease